MLKAPLCAWKVHERNLLREVMNFNFCMRGNKIGSECSKKISDIFLLFFSLTNCGLNGHDFVWPAPKYFLRETVAGGQSQIKRRNFYANTQLFRASCHHFSSFFTCSKFTGCSPLFMDFGRKRFFSPFFSARVWESSVRVNGIYDCCWLFGLVGGWGGHGVDEFEKGLVGKKQLGSGAACPKCRNSATICEFNES